MEHDMIVNEWVSYNTESWKWNSRFILGNIQNGLLAEKKNEWIGSIIEMNLK